MRQTGCSHRPEAGPFSSSSNRRFWSQLVRDRGLAALRKRQVGNVVVVADLAARLFLLPAVCLGLRPRLILRPRPRIGLACPARALFLLALLLLARHLFALLLLLALLLFLLLALLPGSRLALLFRLTLLRLPLLLLLLALLCLALLLLLFLLLALLGR